MAAPADVTLNNLTGKWVMNKTLSSDTEPVLTLQGMNWLMRKAISFSVITLHIKQYETPDGAAHIDVQTIGTGGIKGTSENRVLDWTERGHTDHIFGEMIGKSRFLSNLDGIDEAFLKQDWLLEDSALEGRKWIQSYVNNTKGGWEATQIWGFATINGERRYVRRLVLTKGAERQEALLVYDFLGREIDEAAA